MNRLARLKPWQLWLVVGGFGIAVAFLVSGAIELLWWLRPVLSVLGAMVAVSWAFLEVRRRRVDDEWISS
ncbi:MAG TPA: hypothetical protein VFA44_06665 [Gaiellaceae bacterium]|nr:hypothetical protein [Gaiellaceae bacterium]